MIVLLDTSTPICKLTLVEGRDMQEVEWQADRSLAKGLLKFIQEQLAARSLDWKDLEGIGAYKGPGSFTGLRIGLTVLNTLADSMQIAIVGETGDAWKKLALGRLENGENDQIILPEYGAEANITKPRK
jgi:tRNA threonylcarbamoyladenosine biosynthesis protein TsaB